MSLKEKVAFLQKNGIEKDFLLLLLRKSEELFKDAAPKTSKPKAPKKISSADLAAKVLKETPKVHYSDLSTASELEEHDANEVSHEYDLNPGDKLTSNDLLRSYKNSPQHPRSLLLKYIVHRINHAKTGKKYNLAKDKDFLDFHKQKGSGINEKLEHITAGHLHNALRENPKLIQGVLAHQANLHQTLLDNYPDKIQYIKGKPHLNLVRGLKTPKMGRSHALSSWSDDPNTASSFGRHLYAHTIPLENIWYSFDHGPKENSGNMGPEDEYLVDDKNPGIINEGNPTEKLGKKIHQYITKKNVDKKVRDAAPMEVPGLLRSPLVSPKHVRQMLGRSPENHKVIFKNAKLDKELVQKGLESGHQDYIKKNPHYNKDYTDAIFDHVMSGKEGAYPSSLVTSHLANDPNLDDKQLHTLIEKGYHSALSYNPKLKDKHIKQILDKGPNTSDPDTLNRLFGKSKDPKINHQVLDRLNDFEFKHNLGFGPDRERVLKATEDKSIHDRLMQGIKDNKYNIMPSIMVHSPHTNKEDLETLLDKRHPDFAGDIFEHPLADKDFIKKHTKDGKYINAILKSRANEKVDSDTLAHFADKANNLHDLARIAADSKAGYHIFNKILDNEHFKNHPMPEHKEEVFETIANSKNLDPHTYKKLLDNPDFENKQRLIKNHSLQMDQKLFEHTINHPEFEKDKDKLIGDLLDYQNMDNAKAHSLVDKYKELPPGAIKEMAVRDYADPKLLDKLADRLNEKSHDSDVKAVLGSEHTSPETRSRVFNNPKVLAGDEYTQAALARYPEIFKHPKAVQAMIEGHPSAQEALAQNPEILKYPELVNKLAGEDHQFSQEALAEYPEIFNHPEAVGKLAGGNSFAQRALARNPGIFNHPEVLNRLIGGDEYAQEALARRPDIFNHPEIVNKLAEGHEYAQQSLARHPNLTKEIYDKLKQSSDKGVQDALAMRPKFNKK